MLTRHTKISDDRIVPERDPYISLAQGHNLVQEYRPAGRGPWDQSVEEEAAHTCTAAAQTGSSTSAHPPAD